MRKNFKNRNTVLALSASFLPMAEISRRKAIKAIVTRKADLVNPKTMETYSWVDAGQPIKMIIYRHITRTIGGPRLHAGERGLRAILRRDGYKCSYCGVKLKASGSNHPHRATIDHIIPRVQGGTSEWGNLASSCWFCNQAKAGRTPKEAGMTLIYKPKTPSALLLEKMHTLIESAF